MPGNAQRSPGQGIPRPQATVGSIAHGRARLGPVRTRRAPGPSPTPSSPSRVGCRAACKGLGAWASLHCRTLADSCVPQVVRTTNPHRQAVVQAGKEPGGSAPSWPWQRFRGCVPSPRDQQALEGPGTSVWGKFWGCTGRPRSGRPGGERGPQAPAGCNGATNHGRWQRPAGLASVCQSRVPGAGESEGSRRRAAEAPGRGEGHRAWSGYVLRVVWLSAHEGSSQGGLGALSGPRGPRLVWG